MALRSKLSAANDSKDHYILDTKSGDLLACMCRLSLSWEFATWCLSTAMTQKVKGDSTTQAGFPGTHGVTLLPLLSVSSGGDA